MGKKVVKEASIGVPGKHRIPFLSGTGQAGFGGFQLMEITVAMAGTSRYREKGDLSQTASTL